MSPRDPSDTRAEIPDWKCERFLLNELDEAEMEKIRRAAERDEHLRARLEAIAASNREILREYPPGWMAQQIRARLAERTAAATSPRPRSWFAPRVLVPAGLVAVLALAVFVAPDLIPLGDPTAPDTTRIKGSVAELRLYRKTESGSEVLESGDVAAEHDLILLQYRTDELDYGAILSVDGRGTITRHLPEHGDRAVRIEPGREHLLDYAYELDDAPRWELFVLVTSSSSFVIDDVVRSIEAATSSTSPDGVSRVNLEPPERLDLPEEFRVSGFTLIKGSRHER